MYYFIIKYLLLLLKHAHIKMNKARFHLYETQEEAKLICGVRNQYSGHLHGVITPGTEGNLLEWWKYSTI